MKRRLSVITGGSVPSGTDPPPAARSPRRNGNQSWIRPQEVDMRYRIEPVDGQGFVILDQEVRSCPATWTRSG